MAERIDYNKAQVLFNDYAHMLEELNTILNGENRILREIKQYAQSFVASEARSILAKMDVEEINANHIGIPVAKLKTRYHNLDQVCQASYRELMSITGIGDATARLIIDTSSALKKKIEKEAKIVIDAKSKNPYMIPLITKVYIYAGLSDIFKENKELLNHFPSNYSMDDFKCLKNFLAFNMASNYEKQRAREVYSSMEEIVKGDIGDQIQKNYNIYQRSVALSTIPFEKYTQNKEILDTNLQKIVPEYFKPEVQKTEVKIDFNGYKKIISEFSNLTKAFNNMFLEQSGRTTEIKKAMNSYRENVIQERLQTLPLKTYLDEVYVNLLNKSNYNTFTALCDLPALTIASINGLNQNDAFTIKHIANRVKKEIEKIPVELNGESTLVKLIYSYFMNKDNDLIVQNLYEQNKTKIDNLIKYIEPLKSEKNYNSASKDERTYALRCIRQMDEIINGEFGYIIKKIEDQHYSLRNAKHHFIENEQKYYDFVNSIIPDYAYKMYAEPEVKKQENQKTEVEEKKEEIKQEALPSLVDQLYASLSYLSKIEMISKSTMEPYCSLAKEILNNKEHMEDRLSKFNTLVENGLLQAEEYNSFKEELEELNDQSEYTDIELISNKKNVVNSLYETFIFRQINEVSETREANIFKIYFTDEQDHLISNEMVIEANQSVNTEYKLRFEFKSQTYDLKQKYYMIIKNKKGRIYLKENFKFDISFADDFDF